MSVEYKDSGITFENRNFDGVLWYQPRALSESLNDSVKSKGLGINWGNLLKAAPDVFGHVVQIGTTIASVLTPQDGLDQTIASNTMKTSSVPFKTGYY